MEVKAGWAETECPIGKWVDAPRILAKFNEGNLAEGCPGRRFNPSIIADGEGYVFDAWFKPCSVPVQLNLFHKLEAMFGREDPRLFRYRGAIHVAYAGVIGEQTFHHTSVLYARLGADLQVTELFYPYYPSRNLWEKNWAFFEHGENLYCVYSIAPHKILRVDGNRADLAYETPVTHYWQGGEMRGGTCPVRVDDEYWCFFHDRVPGPGYDVYRTGLYAFSAKPPFALTRLAPEPLLTAVSKTKPKDQYCAVLFAGGAVRNGEQWVVAHGIHDRWSELNEFKHSELEKKLCK